MRLLLSAIFFLAAAPAQAGFADPLADLINAYRAAPGMCAGKPATRMPPLVKNAAFSKVKLGTGMFLDLALERAGYRVEHAEIIYITGADSPSSAMADLQISYCKSLLDERFAAVGTRRNGNEWQVILAQPEKPLPLAKVPDLSGFGQIILDAVNLARSTGVVCGTKPYPPAPPLRWNDALGQAARGHSLDMANQRYFKHQGKDGRMAAERAAAAGYLWRRVGENIAVGQESAEEVVDGWLKSPGHCVNIMEPDFVDMGAAYAIYDVVGKPRVYWTQVFGRPR
jgi:uncharacterized protein YkwD